MKIKDFLRCVRFGDWSCSGGKHRLKGKKRGFQEILRMATGYSDDYVQNKTVYDMCNIQVTEKPTVSDLERLKDEFYSRLKSHFWGHREMYGRTSAKIFQSENSEFLDLILRHSSCGAAMRAPVLGFIGIDNQRLFCLSAMTHLHPEAVAGAFAVAYSVNSLKKSRDFIHQAIKGSHIGENQAKGYIKSVGQDIEYISLSETIEKVLSTNDPYTSIKDIKREGIETRFVVPASIFIARDALLSDNPESALKHSVERSFEIGGDPDTICTMSTAMISAYYQEKILKKIDTLWENYEHQNK